MNTRELVRTIQRTKLFIPVAGTLVILSVGAVRGQDAVGNRPATVATSPSPTASPTAPGQSETIERIVVTANKREENVREVPASITAFDDVELENLHATDLSDYAAYIPSLQVNSVGAPGRTSIALRGITTLSSGSTVGTYIDETPVGSSGLYQAARPSNWTCCLTIFAASKCCADRRARSTVQIRLAV